MKKSRMAIGLGVIFLLGLVGLGLLSRGKLIALEYENFPQSELEKLRAPEGWTLPQELTLSGPVQVEAHSHWTWWAMKLFAGTFLVDARAGGRRLTLVVDTGAELTVLSPSAAVVAQATLVTEGPEVVHWNQRIPTYLGWAPKLEIAGLVASNVPVLVVGKQPTLKLLGLPVYRLDGFLGMSLMKELALALDWRTGTVTLRREPFVLEAPSAPLRSVERALKGFKVSYPVADALLDQQGPYMALIDTGASPAEILVSDELLQILDWKGRVLIRHLRLGEIELRDVWAVPAHEKEATGAKLSGPVMLIGNGLFQAQGIKRLTLDFLAGKLYAER